MYGEEIPIFSLNAIISSEFFLQYFENNLRETKKFGRFKFEENQYQNFQIVYGCPIQVCDVSYNNGVCQWIG